MANHSEKKNEHVRVGGRLHAVTAVYDEVGNLLHKVVQPVMIEFYPRDVLQTIVGATLLAVPMAFTDEIWRHGAELSTGRVLGIALFSIFVVATFVYYNIYRSERKEGLNRLVERGHLGEYMKRVTATYIVALGVSFFLLVLLDLAPLGEELYVTLKRAVLVALPASMSAAVADILK